jgi:epoxyqueuosine reductase QueG
MIVTSILKIIEAEHVPVWGIGPASKMADEPPGHRPVDLLPGAQSLICFGLPMPQSIYQISAHPAEMIWRSQNLYYRQLDTLSLRFAALLEASGERAIPVFGCMPLGLNEKGEVVGYLNQIRMGEATGMGVIGRNGLLVHSHYGARLMLGGVVTTAILPERRCQDFDEFGCPPGCRICVVACPVKAISIDEKRVNIMRCLGYTSRTPLMSRVRFLILRAFRPRSAARLMNLMAFDEHTFHVCSRCVALCPYGVSTHDETR